METTSAAPRLHHLDRAGVRERAAAWTAVYNACFTTPPWHEPHRSTDQYLERIGWHLDQPDLRGVEALDEHRTVVAVAYGWPSAEEVPDRLIYRAIAEVLGDEATAALWAERPFEVVEVMVDPTARGKGLGARLLAAIREGHRTAWLLTRPDSDAPAFYRRLGWKRAAEIPAIGYDLYLHRTRRAS